MDIKRALRSVVTTGKIHIGTNQALKSLKDGTAKLMIVANNCPPETLESCREKPEMTVYMFPGTNFDLGAACGKPFAISILSVVDAGESDILALRKEA